MTMINLNPLKGSTKLWFSWVILVISIISLSLVLLRCEPIEADWVSIDIGILAVLATTLIGWQIFTLINLRRLESEIQRKVNTKIKEEIDKCRVSLEGEIAMVRAHSWMNKAMVSNDINEYWLSLRYSLEALECFVRYPKQYIHEEIISDIDSIYAFGKMSKWLDEEDKNKCIRVLSQTDAPNKHDIIQKILNINTKRPNLAHISVQTVSGEKIHKLIFHNTGDESAYFLRIGFLRKSDANSVSLQCDNLEDFDEVKGDARIVVNVIPNETFNHKLAIRMCYYVDNNSSYHSSLMLDFRDNSDPKPIQNDIEANSEDICIYPNKIDLHKIEELA